MAKYDESLMLAMMALQPIKKEKIIKGGPGSGPAKGAKSSGDHMKAIDSASKRESAAAKNLKDYQDKQNKTGAGYNTPEYQTHANEYKSAMRSRQKAIREGKAFIASNRVKKELIKKGGPGSGVAEENTKKINMPHSPFTSVGTRKGMLTNMAFENKSIPLEKITHVGQVKYVPKKLSAMMKDFEKIKNKPIDVLKVGKEYHVIDGHHRYLAAKKKGVSHIPARVRLKANVQKGGPGSGPQGGKGKSKEPLKPGDKVNMFRQGVGHDSGTIKESHKGDIHTVEHSDKSTSKYHGSHLTHSDHEIHHSLASHGHFDPYAAAADLADK